MIIKLKDFLKEHLVTDTTGLLKGKSLLYHNTTQEFIKNILTQDALKGSTESRFVKFKPGISLSRDFNVHFKNSLFKFALDWDLLKKLYKLTPYDFYNTDIKDVDLDNDSQDNHYISKGHNTFFEAEIIGPGYLSPLSKFLKGIVINFAKIRIIELNIASIKSLKELVESFITVLMYCEEKKIPVFLLKTNSNSSYLINDINLIKKEINKLIELCINKFNKYPKEMEEIMGLTNYINHPILKNTVSKNIIKI